jgi:HEAT repeat protein
MASSAASLARPLLDDAAPGVRAAVCACLGAIRDPAAIAPLLSVIRSDPAPRMRKAALLGVENYRTDEIGEVLLDLIEAGEISGDARSILCRQLWKYPSSRTIELLQRALGPRTAVPCPGLSDRADRVRDARGPAHRQHDLDHAQAQRCSASG